VDSDTLMDTIPRILIVDDDPLIRSTFAKCLKSKHFELAVAEDWRSAFEKVHEFNPHVVLLDVVMPEVPGDKLVETIKGWKSEIEIIIIAALVSDAMKKNCLASGAFAVLSKPIALQDLTETIDGALAKQNLAFLPSKESTNAPT